MAEQRTGASRQPCRPRQPRSGHRLTARVTCSVLGLLSAAGVIGLALALATGPLLDLVRDVAAPRALSDVPAERIVLGIAAAALWGAAAWALLVALALTWEAASLLRGGATRGRWARAVDAALSRLTPAAARRLVLLACGGAVAAVGVAGPAHADSPGSRERGAAGPLGVPAVATTLAGLPLPDRASHAAPGATRTVTVRSGDSLWQIASRLLSETGRPTDAEVAAGSRALARANQRLAPDPDLIFPGTVLRVPPALHREDRP